MDVVEPNTSRISDKMGEKATPQMDPRSGYTWEREEDAPGYAWKSKRAQDEYMKARDMIVNESVMVGSEFTSFSWES